MWHGGFAAQLGLAGEVTVENFRAVLEGYDRATGSGSSASRTAALPDGM